MPWIIILSLLFAATEARAQQTPYLDLAAAFGPSVPLGEFSEDGAEVGRGLSATVTLRAVRRFGVYASYERLSFPVERGTTTGGDGTWTDTGLGVGAMLWLPVRDASRVHPWGQLGVSWHDLDQPIAGPEFSVVDTDGIRTVDGAAGADIVLAQQRVFLRPALRYRRYSFTVENADRTATTRIASLTIAFGLAVVLPAGRPSATPAEERVQGQE